MASTATPSVAHDALRDIQRAQERRALRLGIIRILIVTNVLLGVYYLTWRYTASINWVFWWVSIPLLIAETYSFIDGMLFGTTMWRLRDRPAPPPTRGDETVDVFITCYNEPVELVRETVRAAKAIRHSHQTWVLDDGRSPHMQAMAEDEGVGYIVRSDDWEGRDRHAKAGNINNALFLTDGEFILILDADQKPKPEILDRVLGYFRNPRVSLVQTPQWFSNVPEGDPFGAQAPLFYGPLQQGKDGWNAAFFCGSNAVLRREALLSGGVRRYAEELRDRIRRAIVTSGRVLDRAERTMSVEERARMGNAFAILRRALADARKALRAGEPLQEITWAFQRAAESASRAVVQDDLQAIRSELAEIPGIEDDIAIETQLSGHLGEDDDPILRELVQRDASPLAAVEAVRGLLLAVDVDRDDEAQPVMPMATISVTEDMATSMRMHANGWESVYHHEILATGLAPDDLLSMLKQRLRWAQGTIQVFLRENPFFVRGLSLAQKLMYFATMWSYFSGFFAVVYLLAPVLYLLFGWMPVTAFSYEFFWRITPYLVVNQLLFWVVGRGLPKWRGQQYSLALFPVWIQAVTSAVGNVVFGRKLGFVVTPKTRQGGASLRLIWPQIVVAVLLVIGCLAGLARLATGNYESGTAIVINIGWSIYDLAALSVLLLAVRYRPAGEDTAPVSAGTGVVERGRAGAGTA